MKASVEINPTVKEPYAVIYASELTSEVQRALKAFGSEAKLVTAADGERTVILKPDEIYMVRIENSETFIYSLDKRYRSKKRLYELLEQLGEDFMRISKYAAVNLKKIDYVEPYFGGAMKLFLKNKQSEYISRTYLPDFKKYLGL